MAADVVAVPRATRRVMCLCGWAATGPNPADAWAMLETHIASAHPSPKSRAMQAARFHGPRIRSHRKSRSLDIYERSTEGST